MCPIKATNKQSKFFTIKKRSKTISSIILVLLALILVMQEDHQQPAMKKGKKENLSSYQKPISWVHLNRNGVSH